MKAMGLKILDFHSIISLTALLLIISMNAVKEKVMIQLFTESNDSRLRRSFTDLDETLAAVREVYGPKCDVGLIAGTIVNSNSEEIAEYGEY
jgi:hypothetical protein